MTEISDMWFEKFGGLPTHCGSFFEKINFQGRDKLIL